jgi:hypothetical protein
LSAVGIQTPPLPAAVTVPSALMFPLMVLDRRRVGNDERMNECCSVLSQSTINADSVHRRSTMESYYGVVNGSC